MLSATSYENDSLLEQLRAGFAWVAQRARHVRIREDLLEDYAAGLEPLPQDRVFDATHHFYGGQESTAAYVLTLDSINFGSGYKEPMTGEGWVCSEDSIYFTVASLLKRRFEEDGVISAKTLERFSFLDCVNLLQLPAGPSSREFADLCTHSLNMLGKTVQSRFSGSFLSMVKAASGSAAKMVALLAELPGFRDIHEYDGRTIPILKRAQSTAADLNDAFAKLGVNLFGDIDRLTILADNDVPHVFRMDGLLEYSDDLSARIDEGQDIASGSPEEIEIRACAGYVASRLAVFKGVPDITVDRIIWHRAAENKRYQTLPAHRTKTVFY